MILDKLSKEEKKLVKVVLAKKGKILFQENDPCTSIGIVIKGEVVISSVTFEGNEIIYNTLSSGNIFGNNLLFSKEAFYRGNVIAKSDSEIAFIEKSNLICILQHNEDFLLNYLEINSEFTKSLNSKIKLLSFAQAKERFLYYLFINHNEIRFKNITSLANSLFLSREATSRLINQMIKNKEIIRKGNVIIKEG